MASTASKPRTSHRYGRSIRAHIRTSSRLAGILQNHPVAAVVHVAPRRERLLSLPSTNQVAQSAIEKLQEENSDNTTAYLLHYTSAFKDPDR